MKYHEALKAWNAEQKKGGSVKYIMPKKGSPEYEAVQKIRSAVKPTELPELKAPGNVVAPGPLDKYRGRGPKV